MAKRYIYKIYDGLTATLVYEGTSEGAQAFLGCDKSMLSKIYSKKVKSRFRLTRKEVEKQVKDSSAYVSAKKHLGMYGNTVLNKKHSSVLEMLKKDGYDISAKDGKYGDTYYILELKGKKND